MFLIGRHKNLGGPVLIIRSYMDKVKPVKRARFTNIQHIVHMKDESEVTRNFLR